MKRLSVVTWIFVSLATARADPTPHKQAEATIYHYDRAHGLQRKGTIALEDFWKQMVNQKIALEAADKSPDSLGVRSWKQEWQEWYASIRHEGKSGFALSDLKTSEDMIRYIKQMRRAKGLPMYDP